MYHRTNQFRVLKTKSVSMGPDVQHTAPPRLQQLWIDDDPPDEGAMREAWRDVPVVNE